MNLEEWSPLSDYEVEQLLDAQPSPYYKRQMSRLLAENRMLREQAGAREILQAEEIAW